MKRSALLFLLVFLLRGLLWAGEGMWLPLLLSEQAGDMQRMGMKMTAEDIYSVNQSSLKDAVVLFGSGCTGAVISEQGLLLTNHHCGYSLIRQHSTPAHNRLRDGYWASNQEEELTNPGLKVTFLVRMADVTEEVLADLEGRSEAEQQQAIERRIEGIEARAVAGTHYQAEVKPFYYGNEYYLLVKEVYPDVRLVGAPPEAIGRFGGDTDNWLWPRHNADFSLFRIYSGPDGKPAEYSPDNIPLQPRHHLPISLRGAQPGDFTLVFGFPYRTQEYLPPSAVEQLMALEDPLRIGLRDLRLRVYGREMRANDTIRLMYASKESGISNGYKKWQGRLRGLKRNATLASKQAEQKRFLAAIAENEAWQAAYGGLFAAFDSLYTQREPLLRQVIFFNEGGFGIEAIRFCYNVLRKTGDWQAANEVQREEIVADLRKLGQGHFREYVAAMDQEIMGLILQAYLEQLPAGEQPELVKSIARRYEGDFAAYAAETFAQSALTDSNRYQAMLSDFAISRLMQDPIHQLFLGFYQSYAGVARQLETVENRLDLLMETYVQAQREVFADKVFYPDANQSLRVSYGRVQGMEPRDAVAYVPYTTLDGKVAKYVPGDYEFDLPERLLTLHEAGDYGRYGQEGELRVAFIASNHTSGGNSGSPVIDAEGRLIGLNFDRNWEGTMSDIDYDIAQCRNISVDVRYILFLIDRYAEADHLIEEMTVVE